MNMFFQAAQQAIAHQAGSLEGLNNPNNYVARLDLWMDEGIEYAGFTDGLFQANLAGIPVLFIQTTPDHYVLKAVFESEESARAYAAHLELAMGYAIAQRGLSARYEVQTLRAPGLDGHMTGTMTVVTDISGIAAIIETGFSQSDRQELTDSARVALTVYSMSKFSRNPVVKLSLLISVLESLAARTEYLDRPESVTQHINRWRNEITDLVTELRVSSADSPDIQTLNSIHSGLGDFLHDSNRHRMARYLNNAIRFTDRWEHGEISEKIRTWYTLRSRFLHGGQADISAIQSELVIFENVVRLALRYAITGNQQDYQ